MQHDMKLPICIETVVIHFYLDKYDDVQMN